jgi:lysophospholipase L1-like esterase
VKRHHFVTASLALVSVGVATGAVILVSSGHDGGIGAGAAADPPRCVTSAFPGETETVAPTPSSIPATALPIATPTPTATTPPTRALTAGWSGAWSTSIQDLHGPDLSGQTLRQIVMPTLGGDSFRIRLANTFGTEPLRLTKVTAALAVATGSPGLRSGTNHKVTFEGAESVEIPPGEKAFSDPVELPFDFGQPLAIDIVPQGPAVAGSGHTRAIATSYLAAGDRAGEIAGSDFSSSVASWFWLEGVDVPDPVGTGTISAFGDSITEGMSSTRDRNQRWPDLLAARLHEQAVPSGLGVLNEGIGGNRVVTENLSCLSPSASGLRRFDYDVLDRPDVKVVVIALGINDIASGIPATTVVDGLTALADRAHERGLRVVGATLTPFSCEGGCLSPEKEQQRTLVNDWIRTAPEFDAVVDFDAALRDPAAPSHLLKAYDSGDNLHPSDAGMRAMAASFDLVALTGA